MEEVTANVIGIRETLLAHGLCGILYSIFSVQPIVIPALTGPVLVFEEVIFEVGLCCVITVALCSYSRNLETITIASVL